MKESRLWRDLARKIAECDFTSPVMRLSPRTMRLGDAVMEMYDEGRIRFSETQPAFSRISKHDGAELGPNNRGVNVLAALCLALEAEDEGR